MSNDLIMKARNGRLSALESLSRRRDDHAGNVADFGDHAAKRKAERSQRLMFRHTENMFIA
ncbi:hypothetical protein [Aliiroseovarius sp. YM-037]|uniref:hypothetical protein n=1 Tax=Aliiroseovarius sp. YM-037 TaxID=3341728 RepID=UPI003A7FEA63